MVPKFECSRIPWVIVLILKNPNSLVYSRNLGDKYLGGYSGDLAHFRLTHDFKNLLKFVKVATFFSQYCRIV